MKKTTIFLSALALSLSVTVLTACGNDEPDTGKGDVKDPDDIETPSGDQDVLTPEASKAYLEDVASQYLNLFKANDQRALIDLTRFFGEHYGDMSLPEGWDIDDDHYYDPYRAMRVLRKGASNPLALSRAMDNVYNINLYSGIYEPAGSRWVKSGDADNRIVFRFANASGQQCELIAQGSNDTWDATDFADSDDEVKVLVPKTIDMKLTENGTTLFDGTLKTNPDIRGHKLTAESNVTAANIKVHATVSADDSKVESNAMLTIGGKTVTTATATVKGHNLCNYDFLQQVDDPSVLFTTATADVNILDKIQVKGKVNNLGAIIRLFDRYYDMDEYDNRESAHQACANDCNTLSRNIAVSIFYNSDVEQASVCFRTSLYDDEWWWEWEIAPVLSFPDNTTYEFEAYFGNGRFLSIETQFENLVNSYLNLWR